MKQTIIVLLMFAVFFAAGYFYSDFRKSSNPSLPSISKTTTKIIPESESPLEFVNNNQSNIGGVLAKYYPLQKGNYWEYEGVEKEEQPGGVIETANVKKRVEVVDVRESGDGTIASLDGESSYLIKGNDVYSRQSRGDKLILPFPLYVGQKWGDEDSLRYRDDNSYVWHVEEKFSKKVLDKDYDECFKISYKTNPDSSYFVFCYGLGIVEDGYKHNGTVLEWNYKLTGTSVGK